MYKYFSAIYRQKYNLHFQPFIEQTDTLMRERKELFHKMWEEEQQRITIEQTIFKEQVREQNFSFWNEHEARALNLARG